MYHFFSLKMIYLTVKQLVLIRVNNGIANNGTVGVKHF